MFAVIQSGGKQYKVKAADVITVDQLDAEEGDVVAFDDVRLLSANGRTQLGSPRLADATVAGELVEHTRGAKVIAFKKRRRKNSRRLRGHKQGLSVVRITAILTDGQKPDRAAKPAKTQSAPAPRAQSAQGEGTTMAKAAKKKTAKKPAKKAAVRKPAAKKKTVKKKAKK